MEKILQLVKDLREIEKDIAKAIIKLRKLKAMQDIEILNTKKTTIENQIIQEKKDIIDDMKSKQENERETKINDKKFKLQIKNTKDIWWKDFEYLNIDEIN